MEADCFRTSEEGSDTSKREGEGSSSNSGRRAVSRGRDRRDNQGVGAEPRALESAGVPWRGGGQEEGRLHGLGGEPERQEGVGCSLQRGLLRAPEPWSGKAHTPTPTVFTRGSQATPTGTPTCPHPGSGLRDSLHFPPSSLYHIQASGLHIGCPDSG